MSSEEEHVRRVIEQYKRKGMHPLNVHFVPNSTRELVGVLRELHVETAVGPKHVEVEQAKLDSLFLPTWVHALYHMGRIERGAKVGLPKNTDPKDVPHSYVLDIPEGLEGQYNLIEADEHRMDPDELRSVADSKKEQQLLLSEMALKTNEPLYIEGLKQYAET
jgi:hypothetical protein